MHPLNGMPASSSLEIPRFPFLGSLHQLIRIAEPPHEAKHSRTNDRSAKHDGELLIPGFTSRDRGRILGNMARLSRRLGGQGKGEQGEGGKKQGVSHEITPSDEIQISPNPFEGEFRKTEFTASVLPSREKHHDS
ncbi:MAG: hypothetical protein U0798_06225 [Gemmataceae bacterium]